MKSFLKFLKWGSIALIIWYVFVLLFIRGVNFSSTKAISSNYSITKTEISMIQNGGNISNENLFAVMRNVQAINSVIKNNNQNKNSFFSKIFFAYNSNLPKDTLVLKQIIK